MRSKCTYKDVRLRCTYKTTSFILGYERTSIGAGQWPNYHKLIFHNCTLIAPNCIKCCSGIIGNTCRPTTTYHLSLLVVVSPQWLNIWQESSHIWDLGSVDCCEPLGVPLCFDPAPKLGSIPAESWHFLHLSHSEPAILERRVPIYGICWVLWAFGGSTLLWSCP